MTDTKPLPPLDYLMASVYPMRYTTNYDITSVVAPQ